MQHNTGFYYCTRSNWDGEMFDVTNLVSIEYKSTDYDNLIDKKSLYPGDEYNRWRTYSELKPEIFQWLEENVKNQKDGTKGWCCGDKEYNSPTPLEGFSLFFYRRKDALNFIKTWSTYKKPTEYFNQNTGVLKKLDEKTNTLKVVKRHE